jgi:hypothetical protein
MLAGLIAIPPSVDRATPRPPPPTRLELGMALGDYVLAVGSPTQLGYAPVFELRLAYGLARVGALGFMRLAAPLDLGDSIATKHRQFATGGGLGLRSIFVQRRFIRFGVWLAGTVDRLDSFTRLPTLPGLAEAEHVQKRVTHHAGAELGLELGVPLPVRRGPTVVLTAGGALTFVFPIAASRSGTDVADAHYSARELGVIGPAGGATLLLELGVVLGWDLDQGGGSTGSK